MIEPLKKFRWKLYKDAERTPPSWCWPLPSFGHRSPIALRAPGIDALRSDDSENRLAVDVGYKAADGDPLVEVPVCAVQDGMVRLAAETTDGYVIALDHGGAWATHYAHLDRICVVPQSGRRRSRFEFVPGGTIIGYAAKSPVHVRFELRQWTYNNGYVPVDPLSSMPQWTIYPHHEPTLPVATALETRRAAP